MAERERLQQKMGKLFGAILRFVFMVGLLGLVGYNTWETAQLRREVAALRQQPGRVSVREKPGAVSGGNPASLLASARRHYDSAQEHLGRKEYLEASREALLATQATKKASESASALSGDKLRDFQQAVQSVSSRATELLDQSGESAASKPKSGSPN